MKKRYLIFIFSAILFCFLIFIYNKIILNFYVCSFFKIDFSNDWDVILEEDNSLYLQNENQSQIYVVTQYFDEDLSNEEVYYQLEKDFVFNNDNYNLVNYGKTKIGKKYYNSYEYLFESDNRQLLFVVCVNDKKVTKIIYSSLEGYFDLDLEDFYNISNSLEIF